MPERLEFEIDGDSRNFQKAMREAAAHSERMTRSLKKLAGESDDAEKSLDDVGGATERVGRAAAKSAKQTTTLTGGIAKLALGFNLVDRAINGVVAGIQGLVRGMIATNKAGIDMNLQFEVMGVRLFGVTGSAASASNALNIFRGIAATTAFSVRDVSEAGTTLAAFMGGEFTKNIEGTTKAVADLSAFMGLTATEGAAAMGRAFAGGAGAADILRERGILNLIKSFKGIEDLTKLTLPEFRAALMDTMVNTAGPIAGATDRMSLTTVGAISNMGDAWENFTARLTEGAMPEIRNFALAVTSVFSLAAEKVSGEDGLSGAIAKITAEIKNNTPAIVEAIDNIVGAVNRLAGAIAQIPNIARFIRAGVNPMAAGAFIAPLLKRREDAREEAIDEDLKARLRAIQISAGARGISTGARPTAPGVALLALQGRRAAFAEDSAAGISEANRNAAAAANRIRVTVPEAVRRSTARETRPHGVSADIFNRRALDLELRATRRGTGPRGLLGGVLPETGGLTARRGRFGPFARGPSVTLADNLLGPGAFDPQSGIALREQRQRAEQADVRGTVAGIGTFGARMGALQKQTGATAVGVRKSVTALKEQAKALGINVEGIDENVMGLDALVIVQETLQESIDKATDAIDRQEAAFEKQRKASARLTIANNLGAATNRRVGNAALAAADALAVFGDESSKTSAKVQAAAFATEQLGAAIGGDTGGFLGAAGRVASSTTSASIASGGNPYVTAAIGLLQVGVEIVNAIQQARDGWEKLADTISDRFAGIAEIISSSIAAGFNTSQIRQAIDQFVRTFVTQITIAKIVETALSDDFEALEEAVKNDGPVNEIIAGIVAKVPRLTTQAQQAAWDINRFAIQPGERHPDAATFTFPTGDPNRRKFRLDDDRTFRPDQGERGRTGGITVTTISGGFRDVLQQLANRRDNLLTEIRDAIRGITQGGGDDLALAGAGAGAGGGGTVIHIDTVQVQQVADVGEIAALVANELDVGMARQFAKGNRSKGRRR